MKKVVIVVIGILMIIPVVTKRIINNRNYELDTTTEVYTKAEVDSKLAEIKKSIESNTTAITETKNLLTTIQNSLKNYALKTALIEANSNIDNLLTIANNNTKRIDSLESNVNISGKLIKDSLSTSCNNNTSTSEKVLTTTGDCLAVMLISDYISGTYNGANDNYVRIYGDDNILFESNVKKRSSGVNVSTSSYRNVKVVISSRHSTQAKTGADFVYFTK